MSSQRSTFSLTQLLLLTMLSALIFAWLRAAVEFSQLKNRDSPVWYILGALACTWIVLWWRATAQAKAKDDDFGRYLAILVFILALVAGIVFGGFFDQDRFTDRLPSKFIAIVLVASGIMPGFAGIFLRGCNKLAAFYTVFACLGIDAYLLWLLLQHH